jgi:hypothetical protein
VAIVLAIIAIVLPLIFMGVINVGGGGKDIDVKFDAPKVGVPPTPAPAKPATPAAPSNGG